MVNIRRADAADRAAIYQITLKTGQYGADAAGIYHDAELLGHIFAVPYLVLEPACCFVAEDVQGVVGFVVGTADTSGFNARLENEWWPDLRAKYPIPDLKTREHWTADERLYNKIHRPQTPPTAVSQNFPAHLHLNILPRAQGQGAGRRLFDIWCNAMRSQGAKAAHLDVSMHNPRALAFWQKMGFEEIDHQVYPRSGSHGWYGALSLS